MTHSGEVSQTTHTHTRARTFDFFLSLCSNVFLSRIQKTGRLCYCCFVRKTNAVCGGKRATYSRLFSLDITCVCRYYLSQNCYRLYTRTLSHILTEGRKMETFRGLSLLPVSSKQCYFVVNMLKAFFDIYNIISVNENAFP